MSKTRKIQMRQESLYKYIDALIDTNSRLNVVRLDLYYRQENRDKISLESFNKDINHLNFNKRSNSIFKNIKGYIVKIEQGDNGYNHLHAHAMFFINGQKSKERSSIKIASDIGDYWKNVITKGKGIYHNCNLNQYKENALGRINYNDDKKIELLKQNVASYLCKGEQSITAPDGSNIRAIRRGIIPKKGNRGRPRKNQNDV
ncbi:TPA: inovirus-type Gp2 protein [Campylobacter lari]|nr:inovirus-type Gp2 protein [Campylobacter lari]